VALEFGKFKWFMAKDYYKKYIKGKPLISVKQRQNDSHFWKKLLSLREDFFKYCKVVVGNGCKTSF
jgi:hypothetical protein